MNKEGSLKTSRRIRQDGFRRWPAGRIPTSSQLAPALITVSAALEGKHPSRCKLINGIPLVGNAISQPTCSHRAARVAATSSIPATDVCARRELQGDPRSAPRSLRARGSAGTTRRLPPRRGGGDAAGGGRGALGGEGVLARLGEVSGVVTETRQYGGDRPRPLAKEPPNTR